MDVSGFQKKGQIMTTQSVWQEPGQNQKTKPLLFTRIMRGISDLLIWKKGVKKTSLPSNIYRHCRETPLDVFIDCLVNRNTARLIRSGNPSPMEISKAWEQLFNEYCELSNSPRFRQLLTISKDIGQLSAKLLTVRTCLHVLTYRHSLHCINILKSLGYNSHFDAQNTEQYFHSINNIYSRSKAIEIALEQKKKEYEQLIKEDGKSLNEEDFIQVLLYLSKQMGFHVKAKEISVLEYLSMIKSIKQSSVLPKDKRIPKKSSPGKND